MGLATELVMELALESVTKSVADSWSAMVQGLV
jgi:hypothetical protein